MTKKGRPMKKANARRTVVIGVRVSETEYAELEPLAGTLPVATWAREKLLELRGKGQ
jgi:hypothetical protein